MSFLVFKRVVGMLLTPLPLVGLLLLLTVILWFAAKRIRFAWFCLVLAFLLLVSTAFPYPVRYLARRLEAFSNPVLPADVSEESKPSAIVILGSRVDFPGDARMPALTRLGGTARARLVEGVRLARLYPEAMLVTCGAAFGLEGAGDAMAEAAAELGVDSDRIRRASRAVDTAHEAKLARQLLGDARDILLVTSAVHMTRAAECFRAEGFTIRPAPCDFAAPVSDDVLDVVNRHRWQPRGEYISRNEATWHELMGLAYRQWGKDDGGSGGDDADGGDDE